MFKLLFGLSPAIIATIFGLGGGAVALGGAKLWNDWIDNPGIIREQQAVCVARVEKAASEAQLHEQQRIYQAGRETAEEFLKQQLEAERLRQSQVKELESEITAYEKRLISEGRSCRLDADDLDFLNGLQRPAAPR